MPEPGTIPGRPPAGSGSAGRSGTGSRRWAAGWTSSPRPAPGPGSGCGYLDEPALVLALPGTGPGPAGPVGRPDHPGRRDRHARLRTPVDLDAPGPPGRQPAARRAPRHGEPGGHRLVAASAAAGSPDAVA